MWKLTHKKQIKAEGKMERLEGKPPKDPIQALRGRGQGEGLRGQLLGLRYEGLAKT